MRKRVAVLFFAVMLLSVFSVESLAGTDIAEKRYEKGMESFRTGNYETAFSYFVISGEEKEYAPAQNMLGICYRDGLGTEQNLEEAERYFRLAADQRNPDAVSNLASLAEVPSRPVARETKLWYSANGYPSLEDISAIGDADRIVCPKSDKYLSDYKTRYIDYDGSSDIFVYRNPAKTSGHPERLEEGAKVYVVAEDGTSSCILYKTYDNIPRSGWVSTSFLSETYNGILAEVGTAYYGTSNNIGEVPFSLSEKTKQDKDAQNLVLETPIRNCVGFTLEYKLVSAVGKSASAKRDIYIYNGSDWIPVGSFYYETPLSFHIIVNLSVPVTVYAIAVPMSSTENVSIWARQNIDDVLIADT